jgi:hypothetical protein
MKTIIIVVLLLCFTACSSDMNMQGFALSFDDGVGCAAFPRMDSDIRLDHAPGVLFLHVNQNNRPGVFIDAIASQPVQWQDNSVYTLSGDWRKVSGDLEQIDVNLQHIQNYTEQRAEIIWTLNPESPLYEWVWTRAQSDEEIKLFKLKADNEFHHFSISVQYENGKAFIRTISVDDNRADVNFQAGTLDKEWDSSFMPLLETTNKYTGCSFMNAFSGVSQWRGVNLTRIEIEDDRKENTSTN